MNTVFISYAREDQKDAERLYMDLRLAEINAWLDTKCLLPGQNWKREINRTIKTSSYFIALISNNSVSKRGYIQKEMKNAFDVLAEVPSDKIFIIPVRLDNTTPIDEELLNLNWVNLFESYSKGLNRILSVISHLEKEKIEYRGPNLPLGHRAPIEFEPFKNYSEFIREIITKFPISAHFINTKHSYYICFKTKHEDTKIPEYLLEKYPEEMTIVIQHRFYNFIFHHKYFSLDLSFDDKIETLQISYESIFLIASTVGFKIEKVEE